MSQTTRYVDFILSISSPYKTPDKPFEIGRGAFVDANGWVAAKMMWLDAIESDGSRHSHAKSEAISIRSRTRRDKRLLDAGKALLERCDAIAKKHGGCVLGRHTIYNQNGASISGTLSELVAATGMRGERVRDLLTKRRRFVGGWSHDPAEAARGPNPPGRPKKPAKAAVEEAPTKATDPTDIDVFEMFS